MISDLIINNTYCIRNILYTISKNFPLHLQSKTYKIILTLDSSTGADTFEGPAVALAWLALSYFIEKSVTKALAVAGLLVNLASGFFTGL